MKQSKPDATPVEPSSSSKKTNEATQSAEPTQKHSKKTSSSQEKTSTTSTTTSPTSQAKWANYFPETEAIPTEDPRIFLQDWKHVSGSGMQIIKKRQYFACIIGGDCYGVEVFKEWAVDATPQCTTAFTKVKAAADYKETHGTWPSQESNQNTIKGEDPQ